MPILSSEDAQQAKAPVLEVQVVDTWHFFNAQMYDEHRSSPVYRDFVMSARDSHEFYDHMNHALSTSAVVT